MTDDTPQSCASCAWAEWTDQLEIGISEFGECAFPLPTPIGKSQQTIRRTKGMESGQQCRCWSVQRETGNPPVVVKTSTATGKQQELYNQMLKRSFKKV